MQDFYRTKNKNKNEHLKINFSITFSCTKIEIAHIRNEHIRGMQFVKPILKNLKTMFNVLFNYSDVCTTLSRELNTNFDSRRST